MRADRRAAARKNIDCIEVHDLTSVNNYRVIARSALIVNASSSGFLMEIDRKNLVPPELRDSLSLEACLGQQVVLYLPQMNLDLDGTIARTNHIGRGRFLVAVDFSPDVPEYWRECLVDLLPGPGEMEILEED